MNGGGLTQPKQPDNNVNQSWTNGYRLQQHNVNSSISEQRETAYNNQANVSDQEHKINLKNLKRRETNKLSGKHHERTETKLNTIKNMNDFRQRKQPRTVETS